MTDGSQDKQTVAYDSQSVLNPISPILVIIAAAAVLVELVLQLAHYEILGGAEGPSWRLSAVLDFGFQDKIFEHFLLTGFGDFFQRYDQAWTFITYPWISFSVPGMLIGVAIFLAFGRMVSLRFSLWAALVVFVAGILVSGVAYGLVSSSGFALVGLFEPSCALIGAYCWSEYRYRKVLGEPVWPAFRIIFFLAIFNVVSQLFLTPSDFWVAQLAAAVTGFGLSYVVAPGAARRIVERLRGN